MNIEAKIASQYVFTKQAKLFCLLDGLLSLDTASGYSART